MTVYEPFRNQQADDLQVASAIKSLCSWVKSCSAGAVIGLTVLLAYWWLLLPFVCWLGLHAAQQKRKASNAPR